MVKLPLFPFRSVGILTLGIFFAGTFFGCSLNKVYYQDPCKTRAYLDGSLLDHVNRRFHSHAPVRMAIIPYSAPANLAGYDNELPGVGNNIAWQLHAEFLHHNELPIVEVLNRQDWPGKKEEFYTGNHGALSLARSAGYDLVLVGSLNELRQIDTMAADTKIIEAESGLTLWYGRTSVQTSKQNLERNRNWYTLSESDPNNLYLNELVTTLAQCIAASALGADASYPGWDL